MRIGNTISLAWCLTTRTLISLLNKFTGRINNILHFFWLLKMLFQNENFAFKVSLSLIRPAILLSSQRDSGNKTKKKILPLKTF